MQCTADGERPLYALHGLQKVLSDMHPDVITVDAPDKKTIPVKLVRDACADLFVRPNEGARKIYLFPRRARAECAGAERPAQMHRGAAPLRHVFPALRAAAAADRAEPLCGAAALSPA